MRRSLLIALCAALYCVDDEKGSGNPHFGVAARRMAGAAGAAAAMSAIGNQRRRRPAEIGYGGGSKQIVYTTASSGRDYREGLSKADFARAALGIAKGVTLLGEVPLKASYKLFTRLRRVRGWRRLKAVLINVRAELRALTNDGQVDGSAVVGGASDGVAGCDPAEAADASSPLVAAGGFENWDATRPRSTSSLPQFQAFQEEFRRYWGEFWGGRAICSKQLRTTGFGKVALTKTIRKPTAISVDQFLAALAAVAGDEQRPLLGEKDTRARVQARLRPEGDVRRRSALEDEIKRYWKTAREVALRMKMC